MQTWLDSYIAQIGDAVRSLPASPIFDAVRRKANTLSDVEAALDLARESQACVANFGARLPDGIIEFAGVQSMILPFLPRPDSKRWNGPTPVAIRPSAELVELLVDARPPRGQSHDLQRSIRGGDGAIWYVDLPHHAWPRRDWSGTAEPRAIFFAPGVHPDEILRLLLMTIPGSNRVVGRVWWGNFRGIVRSDLAGEIDCIPLSKEVDDFVALLAMYRRIADKAQRGEVPFMSPEVMNKNPRRAQANRKKYSIFRVETLTPPPDKFGRTITPCASRGGWQLSWRVTVRGHFRLQPCGPGSTQRKLIFVASHERGAEDAPRRNVLEKVEKSEASDRSKLPTAA